MKSNNMRNTNKKPFVRLRHIALVAIVLAAVVIFNSLGLTTQAFSESWGQVLAQAAMWLLLALLIYTYAGYPIILALLSRVHNRPVNKGGITPSVSVILAAYNEESVIRQKIDNLLAVDYPSDRLEILIGSDGSNDRTAGIAKSFNDARIKVFDYQERAGKVSVLNRLVLNAAHEILIFTDASEMFDPQAVRRLVANFADPYVGAVSGQLMMTS